jgi:transcriptional regulator with XRE-family HTH domain
MGNYDIFWVNNMTVSERIFAKLEELSMSQKEFSEKTGILPSTISEWKKKKTNPLSEKIMPICEALHVTPEWLLSGDDPEDNGKTEVDYYRIKKDTDIGRLIAYYERLEPYLRERVMGYAEAFSTIKPDLDNDNPDRKTKKQQRRKM